MSSKNYSFKRKNPTEIVGFLYYSSSRYSSIRTCQTNSSTCDTMIIVPAYSSSALAMTGR